MNQIAIGSFIAKKRKEKNLTQEQLAEKLGISNKTAYKPCSYIDSLPGRFDECSFIRFYRCQKL